jgi:hypothetical protein
MAIYVDFKKDPILTGEEVFLFLFNSFVKKKISYHTYLKENTNENKTQLQNDRINLILDFRKILMCLFIVLCSLCLVLRNTLDIICLFHQILRGYSSEMKYANLVRTSSLSFTLFIDSFITHF